MIDPGLIDMVMRLRGRGISDNAVLRAIELVPRKYFISAPQSEHAYIECPLPIACGQTMNAPMTVALMSQVLGLNRDHKLLMVGLGSGYHAAILSRIVTRVYAVERYKKLIAQAETIFSAHDIMNIVIRHGDGRYGWAGQAPFDRIILTCALRAAPEGLLGQLAPNGMLLAVIDEQLILFSKARSKITETVIMPLSLDMIEAGKSRTL
ncbi:MAG: protein-L-isoaspartate(D-aspartate) O-methyltransferase [Litorimonas sp.]